MALKNKNVYGPITIFVVTALIIVVHMVLDPFISYYDEASKGTIIMNNVLFVLPAGLLGLFFAQRMGFPWWWRPGNGSPDARRGSFVVIFLGVFIVVSNTFINFAGRYQIAQSPLFALVTPKSAIGLSLHATLFEETFFRLFLFSAVAWAANYLSRSRNAAIAIGAVVSILLFALVHGTGGMFTAFVLGFGILYIYYKRGLLPAMMVHFFADAIPFVLISMTL